MLRPFIDAYRVVAEELINLDPQRAVDEKQFFDRCLRLAKQWSSQHRIASKESVSLEMFTTALKMARHRGLVDPDATADIGERRRALVQQLDELQTSIETLAAYARKRDFSSDAFSTARKEW